MSDNPLLNIQFEIPFDRIEPAHVEPAIEQLLKESADNLEALAADSAPRTFANTMLAMEKVTEKLDYAMSVVRHLEGVRTTPELRAAYNAVEPPVSEFYSRIPLHEGLWKQLLAFCQDGRSAGAYRVRGGGFLPKRWTAFAATARNWMRRGKPSSRKWTSSYRS